MGAEEMFLTSQRPELTVLKGCVCMWLLVPSLLSTMSSFLGEAMGREHMHLRDKSTRTIFSSGLSPAPVSQLLSVSLWLLPDSYNYYAACSYLMMHVIFPNKTKIFISQA